MRLSTLVDGVKTYKDRQVKLWCDVANTKEMNATSCS